MNDIKNRWIKEKKDGNPYHMLSGLPLTPWQLRLFSVGCCRLVWDKITYQSSRTAIEVAERFAYGKTTSEELYDAWHCAHQTNFNLISNTPESQRAFIRSAAACARANVNSYNACDASCASSYTSWDCVGDFIIDAQGTILAQIVGEDVNIPKYVLTHTVVNLAKYIWDNRDWSVIPILADALQDAGFSDENLLNQFRTEAVWCRGGKAIDLLSGIEQTTSSKN